MSGDDGIFKDVGDSAWGPDVDRSMPAFGGLLGDIGHAASHAVHSVGHFASNAAKVAGKEIGHVGKSIQSAGGAITSVIGKIPVVGAPVNTIMSAQYQLLTGPAHLAADIASGKRVDRAVVGNIKKQVAAAKSVAPYAQMAVSMVPGVGTGVSAALGAGLALADGQPIDKALVAGAISAVPGGPAAQMAAKTAATALSAAAHGEKYDVGNAVADAISVLPIPPAAKEALKTGVTMTAAIASGKKVDAAVADAALHTGMAHLSPAAKKAFQTGLGLQAGAVLQQLRATHLPEIHGKLAESGIQLSKTLPAVAEARKLVGQGTRGYDIGHGLLSQRASLFDIVHTRDALKSPHDKKGFDMALATRIGLVAHPAPKNMTPAAVAGHAIAHGIRGMPHLENKKSILHSVSLHPSASVGAKVAVKQAALQKENWLRKLVRIITGRSSSNGV